MISNHVLVADYFRMDELKSYHLLFLCWKCYQTKNSLFEKKRAREGGNSLSEKPHTVFSCALRKKVISSCSSKAKVVLSSCLTGQNVVICQKGNSVLEYCYALWSFQHAVHDLYCSTRLILCPSLHFSTFMTLNSPLNCLFFPPLFIYCSIFIALNHMNRGK